MGRLIDGFHAFVDALRANFTTNTNPGRTLNGAAYQPNVGRPTLIEYVVEITASATVSGGSDGTITLSAGPTSAVGVRNKTAKNSFTITLGAGIAWTSTQRWTLSMLIPKGWYARLTTAGAATMTLISQEETPL